MERVKGGKKIQLKLNETRHPLTVFIKIKIYLFLCVFYSVE